MQRGKIFGQAEKLYLYLYLALLSVIYLLAEDHGTGMAQWARFDLTKAIVEGHTFKIDGLIENTVDWSYYNGHYYAAKAPGASFWAVPFYYLFWRFSIITDLWLDNYSVMLQFINFFVTIIPSVALAYFIYGYAKIREKNSSRRDSGVVLYTYSLATLAFPFSAILWGHQTAASFLFISFYLMSVRHSFFWSGLLLGAAVLTDYIVGPAVAFFTVYLLFTLRRDWNNRMRALVRFALGGLPMFALFAYYNYECFDHPLRLAYLYQNPLFSPDLPDRLFGVIAIPDLKILYELTFGFYRGLFTTTPIMFLGLIGLITAIIKNQQRPVAVVSLMIFLSVLSTNAGFTIWDAGDSSGPRYLVPALPFLAVGLIYVRTNWLFYSLLALSVINVTAIASVTSASNHIFKNLLFGDIFPNLLHKPERIMNFLTLSACSLFALFLVQKIQTINQRSSEGNT